MLVCFSQYCGRVFVSSSAASLGCSGVQDNVDVRAKAHHLLELKRTGKSHDMAIVDTDLANYVFGLQKYYEVLLPNHVDTKPKVDIPAMSMFLMEVVMSK